MNLFISYLFTDPPLFFAVSVIVVFSVCAHEFTHAWTATLCGDNTASDAGYLTFNPFRQMGVWSLITFAIFGLAWGRVPVNTANFTKKLTGSFSFNRMFDYSSKRLKTKQAFVPPKPKEFFMA